MSWSRGSMVNEATRAAPLVDRLYLRQRTDLLGYGFTQPGRQRSVWAMARACLLIAVGDAHWSGG